MIKKLDESIINKIAAGEVVERPASVIKELVENAIDAGAKKIIIEVKAGGKTLIRISDDGHGMSADDIPIAILPHTTSKISDEQDLYSIRTLGFRGEALASINAVSQMEITSKKREESIGTYFVSDGLNSGKISKVGAPNGTTILVKNLFYNTPARKKFLKTNGVELSYISELVERLALAKPDISFKFVSNNEVKLFTKGDGSLHNVIYSVYNREIGDKLVDISYEGEGIKVNGFVGKPELNRGNKSYESFFINGRYIKSKIIEKALENAFTGRLMKHRFPFSILHIELDFSKLDVNVHPNKLEVRFDDENFIYDSIYKAVKDALDAREYIISIEERKKSKEKEVAKDFFYEDIKKESSDNEYLYEENDVKNLDSLSIKEDATSGEYANEKSEILDILSVEKMDASSVETLSKKEETIDFSAKVSTGEQRTFLSDKAIKKHRIVGQVFDTFWIVEMDEKMYMLDQHAAHEKILYEKLVNTYKTGNISSQALLFPLALELNGESKEYLKTHIDDFKKIGFDLDEFGDDDYVLRAVPYILNDNLDESILLSLVDEMIEYNRASSFNVYLDTLATVACKAAVKAGDKISFKECESMLLELMDLENPYNCPHGRPTIIVFDKKKLEKDFKRIV